MGVLAKITKRVLRAAERAFCVNHPVGAEQRAQPRCEGLRILQCGECSMEGDFVLRMQRFEAIHELAPEHCFEYVDRQEEILLRVDPPRMVRRQSAGRDNTMNMRMMLEFLVPGVEDAEEPDLDAETLRITGDLKQCLGAGARSSPSTDTPCSAAARAAQNAALPAPTTITSTEGGNAVLMTFLEPRSGDWTCDWVREI